MVLCHRALVFALFDKEWIVGASLAIMVVSALAYIASPVAALCYVPIFAFYLLFGVSYPTLLGLFSSSVGKDDQGWVMGVARSLCSRSPAA